MTLITVNSREKFYNTDCLKIRKVFYIIPYNQVMGPFDYILFSIENNLHKIYATS